MSRFIHHSYLQRFVKSLKSQQSGIIVCSTTALLTTKCYADYLQNGQLSAMTPPQNSIMPQLMITSPKEIKIEDSAIKKRFDEIIKSCKKLVRYFKRLLTYAILGTPAVVMGATAKYVGNFIPEIEDLIWDYCIWAVQKLGPTFIKMAQWASTRPDLYPPRLIGRLCRLQDDVKVEYPFSTVENTLKEAFGDKWRERFELDPKPIGAGCVAQVFRAIMNENGVKTPVAIKLIHPHIESTVKTDMELLHMTGAWLDGFESTEMLNLGEVMADFADAMRNQMD
jgi:predicted unusual protein kinase regulating ubiquinone biosynthesis (AarF/ABC1/UbiB family)